MNFLKIYLVLICFFSFIDLFGQSNESTKKVVDSLNKENSFTVDQNTAVIGSNPVSENTKNTKFYLDGQENEIGIRQFNDSVNTSRYSYFIRIVENKPTFTLFRNKESVFNYLNKKIPVQFIKSLNNENLYSSSRKQGLTYINFWASWCAACISEFDLVDSIRLKYPNVNFIGISPESDSLVRQFKLKHSLPFKVAKDGPNLTKVFENAYYPMHIVIDKTGVIKDIIPGLLQGPKLTKFLEALKE